MADTLVDDLKRALGDAYTIERELTGGGMSRVFVAKEHALGREVVIKVLPPDLAAGVNRNRFRQEVQLAARLSHPYIVPLLHAGEHDELLWFTMPYIAGESLRTRLARSGALKLPEVLKLLHDVVEALAYAHSRGVIHRDIKPGNILSDGRHALVTDFGVAKALNAALPMGGPGHTTSGMAIGTPAYMAPEQLAADPEADHRVDLYAVGLLAYELLSGVSPFAAPSPTATMTAQLTRVPQPLHQISGDIPTAFSDLVQHLLAKSPEERPPDAQAVLLELDRISGALAADAHRSTSGETNGKKRASSLPLVFATVGVLVLITGGFLWSQRHNLKPAPADSSATRLGTDADSGLPLAPRPLTHQDSLRIAEAFRSELAQLEPKAKTNAKTQAPPQVDTAQLALQIAAFDSAIKQRLGEMRRPAPPPDPSRGTVLPPATVAVGAGLAAGAAAATSATGAGPKRIVISSFPMRGNDTGARGLETRITSDLQEQLGRSRFFMAAIDTSPPQRGGRGGRGNNSATRSGAYDSADVSVSVWMQPVDKDSSILRITLRNAAAGTFEAQSITSKPVYKPTSIDQFKGTINDAVRLLNYLRKLPPGAPWPKDSAMRGNARSGPGGPSDPGAIRVVDQRQLEQMSRLGDSMKKLAPKPKKRDSTP